MDGVNGGGGGASIRALSFAALDSRNEHPVYEAQFPASG